MAKVLELFSGTGSIRKVCDTVGWETISLDLVENVDHKVDILDFDYKQYPVGFFDIVWASPPCTEYSRAKTRGVRDIDAANKIVLKTLEIIDYFNPTWWFIENPQTGKLKDQPFMASLPYVDCDYCMYGKPYRKRTRIWSNKTLNLKLCDKKCGSMVGNKHIGSCGTGRKLYTNRNYSLAEKHSMPPLLVQDILLEFENEIL
jgi:hypothetical protein